jgi:hypothetical protein
MTVTARQGDRDVTYHAEPVGEHLAITRLGDGPCWQVFHRPTNNFIYPRTLVACHDCAMASAELFNSMHADWGQVTPETAVAWDASLSELDRGLFSMALRDAWSCTHLPEEEEEL